jgi:hypothetical protein
MPGDASCSVTWIDPGLLDTECEDSTCALCLGLLVDPVIGCSEGHSFCRACYGKALDRDKRCPVCRHPATKTELVPNRTAETLIAKMGMRCENAPKENAGEAGPPTGKRAKLAPVTVQTLKATLHTRGLPSTGNKAALLARLEETRKKGCAWKGCVGDLATHRGECAWAQVKCPYKGCTESPLRTILAKHQSTCGERLVTCDCNEQMPCKFLEEHKALCHETEIACPNESCSAKHARWLMHLHDTICEYAVVACPCPGCETPHLPRKDLDAHVRDCHLEGVEVYLQHLWRQAAEQKAVSESEQRLAAVAPTSWVFNWRADGWGPACCRSETHDFCEGFAGSCLLKASSDLEHSHFIGFRIEVGVRCKMHATFSILDKHDKTLRTVKEMGTAAAPVEIDFTLHPSWGVNFTPTVEEKAQSVRADGSIRLRAVVRLFLD